MSEPRPLLVWCRMCNRYISSEPNHGCALTPRYRRDRYTARSEHHDTKGAA